jgi:hypothetical protein
MDTELNFKLQQKLYEYRDNLYEYLFSNKDDIDKWKTDDKVLINNNFIPLLQGDWTRKFKNYVGLDLSKFIGKTIKPSELFSELLDELNRKVTYKNNDNYIHNFNPNLFFLFFEEFYDSKVKGTKVKFGPKIQQSTIYGLTFNSSTRSVLREEIINLIEMHSMFILNSSIINILNKNDFISIFIENCYIQYKIKDETEPLNNRYIDIAYLIKKEKLETPFLIEINEKHHSEILDYFREIDIYRNATANTNNVILNNNFEAIEVVFEKILFNFCKSLYKTNYITEAIILHLVNFCDLKIREAKLGVELKTKSLKLSLIGITELPFFDTSPLDFNKLAKYLHKKNILNPETDFENWYEIYKEYKSTNTPKDKLNLVIYKDNKEKLILNTKGVMKILTKIPTELWPEQDSYYEYLENIQSKYIESISTLLKGNFYENMIDKYNEYTNIIKLAKYDQAKYFEMINNKKSNNIYHDKLPFLIKLNSKEKENPKKYFVHFSMYKNIVKNKYLKELTDYDIFTVSNIEIIKCYRVMTPREVDKLYNEKETETEFID